MYTFSGPIAVFPETEDPFLRLTLPRPGPGFVPPPGTRVLDGGLFNVDSFFDITTGVEIDGAVLDRIQVELDLSGFKASEPVLTEIFSDGFESGNVSVWSHSGSEVNTSQVGEDSSWIEIDPGRVVFDVVAETITFPIDQFGLFALAVADDRAVSLNLATAASANFVVWTARPTTASDAFSGDTVQVVWRWNGDVWESFNPNVPPILSTDFALGAGPGPDVLWLVTSGPVSVDAPAGGAPPPAGPSVVLAAGESADFVVWPGGETTAAALFGDLDTVVIVWRWDGTTWVAFNPALPLALRTDFALGAGDPPDLLWLVTTGRVEVARDP